MKKEVKKATSKKPVANKKPVAKKVTMISYSIKMVIPTVQYGNIQPEIVVNASSPEEAHDFIAPHMNKLWKEYYLVDGKRPEATQVAPKPVVTPKPAVAPKAEATPSPVIEKPVAESPMSSAALVKATQAIESCTGKEALNIIIDRIHASTKLSKADKDSLFPLLEQKHATFGDDI